MKDIYRLWGRLAGRTYSAVNTTNRDSSDEYNTDIGQPYNQTTISLSSANNKAFTSDQHRTTAKSPKSIISIAFVGLIAIASACFVLFVSPYNFLFKWKITFSDGGEIFEMWRVPPVDLYLRVFLFNVTNSEAFLAGTEKMKVVEVGPYVYREALAHANVTFNPNGTLSAIPNHPLEWVPELSEGHTEEDELILPNIALLSITHVIRDASYFTRLGLNLVIRQTKSEPLVRMTAKEFMFGYESKLLTLGNNFMPGWITFDKLGLIDRMYDFDGDYETIFTGDTDARKSGLLDTYRGSTDLPHWDGKHCSNIQGASDGTKFPSFIEPNDKILFYRKSLCRGSTLIRINDTTRQNLDAYRYTFVPNAMDNGYFDPENKCFCRNGNCLPYGLLDVTDCYYGFPIALSYPHFLYSDPTLLNAVEGCSPDPSKHESYFMIQPTSGLPLDVAVRFQINMAMGDVSTMAKVEKFSNMVLPMLWMEIRMYSLPDFLAARMKLYLNVLPTVEVAAMYGLYLIGSLFVFLSVYRLAKMKFNWSRLNRISNHNWIGEDIHFEPKRTAVQKSNNRISGQPRDSVHSKELEVYYNSLITPLNTDIPGYSEFMELREDDV